MMDSQVLVGMLRRGQTGNQILEILEAITNGQEKEVVSIGKMTEDSDPNLW